MENIINFQCYDLNVFLCLEEKIFVDFIGYDSDKKEIINVVAPIHEQIDEIYQNRITKEFLQRLVYKLKFSVKIKPTNISFVKENGFWLLKTPFNEIYNPVVLTQDGTKIGDNPLIIDGKVLRLYSLKEKILLECLVKEISPETNEFVEKVIAIKVNKEINTIYNNKEEKNKFRDLLNIKSKYKQAFLNAWSECLQGKTIKIEFNENYGYSLWTILEDFILFDK